jgi:hypothetical protein
VRVANARGQFRNCKYYDEIRISCASPTRAHGADADKKYARARLFCVRMRWCCAYVHSKKIFAQFALRAGVETPESIKKERISAK